MERWRAKMMTGEHLGHVHAKKVREQTRTHVGANKVKEQK